MSRCKCIRKNGKHFVFAVNVGKYVLTPAGVVQPMVDSFITDVSNGLGQASFDAVLIGTLTEGFLVSNAREWARSELPFCEAIISQQVTMQLGLGVEERNRIDAAESKQVQDRWKNGLLKDVSEHMDTMSAFNNSKGNFQEDDRKHQSKVESNARRAAFHVLFGKKPDEETDGSDAQQPALLQCETEELHQFGDKVVGTTYSFFAIA